MITIPILESQFYQEVPRKFRTEINNYIDAGFVQSMLKKAISYELTDNEISHLFKVGRHKNSKYPHFYWLCTIYIHPLTVMQYIVGRYS